jgi:ADP-ribose pyrophosphatase
VTPWSGKLQSSGGPELETDGGFRIAGARVLYDHAFLRFEDLTVDTPSGPVTRVAVRHPGAVAVIPVQDSQVFLIRQYRAAVDSMLLEVPAGTRDVESEAPEQTAMRELVEEIGFRAGRLERVFEFYTAPGFSDELMTLYLATELTSVPSAPDGPEEEQAEVVAVALEEIPDLLASGEIADAKTVIGLQWLAGQTRV